MKERNGVRRDSNGDVNGPKFTRYTFYHNTANFTGPIKDGRTGEEP